MCAASQSVSTSNSGCAYPSGIDETSRTRKSAARRQANRAPATWLSRVRLVAALGLARRGRLGRLGLRLRLGYLGGGGLGLGLLVLVLTLDGRLELADAAAERLAEVRELTGPKNDQHDDQNDDQVPRLQGAANHLSYLRARKGPEPHHTNSPGRRSRHPC